MPTSALKIEKGVPLAPAKRNGARYPWADMEIGDSILVPYDGREIAQVGANVSSAAASGLGRGKYRTARESNGIRVWRLA